MRLLIAAFLVVIAPVIALAQQPQPGPAGAAAALKMFQTSADVAASSNGRKRSRRSHSVTLLFSCRLVHGQYEYR